MDPAPTGGVQCDRIYIMDVLDCVQNQIVWASPNLVLRAWTVVLTQIPQPIFLCLWVCGLLSCIFHLNSFAIWQQNGEWIAIWQASMSLDNESKRHCIIFLYFCNLLWKQRLSNTTHQVLQINHKESKSIFITKWSMVGRLLMEDQLASLPIQNI